MLENPKVEICGMNKEGQWIRVAGEVANDDRREVRGAALEAIPSIKNMYSADDGIFTVLYFTKGTATISSFTAEPETFQL